MAGYSLEYCMKISFPLGGCPCKACLTGFFAQCGRGNFFLGVEGQHLGVKVGLAGLEPGADTSTFCPGQLKVSYLSLER